MSRSRKKYAGGKYCGHSDKIWKSDTHRKERSKVRDALKALEKDTDNNKAETLLPKKKQEVSDIYDAPSDGGTSFWYSSKQEFFDFYRSMISSYGKHKGERLYTDEEIERHWFDIIGK